MDAVVTQEQLQEYGRQLADVEELLALSPEDASLLSLKSDLQELLALTRSSLEEAAASAPATAVATAESATAGAETTSGLVDTTDFPSGTGLLDPTDQTEALGESGQQQQLDHKQQQQQQPVKKKSKKVKEFEVPAHLMIHEADTEAEKNRKRRATKALKNKWRERKKEVETDMKQQSWQNFQHKTMKRKDNQSSIFATQDGEHAARVGVVSASRGMTEFGERKRHKHA